MSSRKISGVLLATAAAALFSTATIATAADETAAVQVKCAGVNACKGMSECGSAANACKGQNSCKGSGWLNMSKTDCAAKGGKEITTEEHQH